SAHIYLTYPFVLSWSLIEALSSGCLVIGSDTAPVREVINGQNGILVPFFDIEQLADRVIDALTHPRRFHSFRTEARRTAIDYYDVTRVCLPELLEFVCAGDTVHSAPRQRHADVVTTREQFIAELSWGRP